MTHRGRRSSWDGGHERGPGGRSGGWGGSWGGPPWAAGRHGGPPPWLAGLFGMGAPERPSGPRVRRGDVRSAILDVVATATRDGETLNGYQAIQQIAARSEGAWRPSPGSVYPTIQQLEDEGLVENTEEQGRRSLRLTAAGHAYVDEHADELAAVWRPFEGGDARSQWSAGKDGRESGGQDGDDGPVDLRSEIGQVMPAVWQILSSGSDAQRRAALAILADARRKLYGVLADGPDAEEEIES